MKGYEQLSELAEGVFGINGHKPSEGKKRIFISVNAYDDESEQVVIVAGARKAAFRAKKGFGGQLERLHDGFRELLSAVEGLTTVESLEARLLVEVVSLDIQVRLGQVPPVVDIDTLMASEQQDWANLHEDTRELLRHWIVKRDHFLNSVECIYTQADVCKVLNIEGTNASRIFKRLVDHNQLLGVQMETKTHYPLFQFDQGKIREEIKESLAQIKGSGLTEWDYAFWLTTPTTTQMYNPEIPAEQLTALSDKEFADIIETHPVFVDAVVECVPLQLMLTNQEKYWHVFEQWLRPDTVQLEIVQVDVMSNT